ncbi:hypothetical protein O181_094943 [Austropuccinia psidii MF-1]|uniref:Integrase zinc-binding domain-containing protein n=1 Tax=Austropuccinia psidii MF-1 TaxID=1389203 RepID=A0A9Q3PAQ5_9BASI|nr:hypothetical protein [Austropuccinia psidii MF-1]
MGHMSEDKTTERVASTAWWPKWEHELSEYINTCERCQKANRKNGKKYGLLQHIEEPKHPLETLNMDWVTGLVPGGKESFNACLIIADRFSKSMRCLPCHKGDTGIDTALTANFNCFPSSDHLYSIKMLESLFPAMTPSNPSDLSHQRSGNHPTASEDLLELSSCSSSSGPSLAHKDYCILTASMQSLVHVSSAISQLTQSGPIQISVNPDDGRVHGALINPDTEAVSV